MSGVLNQKGTRHMKRMKLKMFKINIIKCMKSNVWNWISKEIRNISNEWNRICLKDMKWNRRCMGKHVYYICYDLDIIIRFFGIKQSKSESDFSTEDPWQTVIPLMARFFTNCVYICINYYLWPLINVIINICLEQYCHGILLKHFSDLFFSAML